MENKIEAGAVIPQDDWEAYFKWEHLKVEKLQKASTPFCKLGQQIARGAQIEENAFRALIIWARENLPDNRQRGRAIDKLGQAEEAYACAWEENHALDILLEAKDCAVRSVLAGN